MEKRSYLLVIAAGMLAASTVSPAHAIIQTQTVGPVSFSATGTTISTATSPTSFPGFNASLGTLGAVKLTGAAGGNFTASFGGTIGFGQFDTTSRTYTVTAAPTFTFGNVEASAFGGTSSPVGFSPPGSNTINTIGLTTVAATGSYSGAISALTTNTNSLKSYFSGTPSIVSYATLWALTAPTGGGFFNNNLTFSGSQLYLTYEYDDGLNPVPGPLPILGAGTAFGFSRKLRKRIRSSGA